MQEETSWFVPDAEVESRALRGVHADRVLIGKVNVVGGILVKFVVLGKAESYGRSESIIQNHHVPRTVTCYDSGF